MKLIQTILLTAALGTVVASGSAAEFSLRTVEHHSHHDALRDPCERLETSLREAEWLWRQHKDITGQLRPAL